MNKKLGRIFIEHGANVWPHELKTAKALIVTGNDVKFLKAKNKKGDGSADIKYLNKVWEIKSPHTDNLKAIERNLRRGKNQSKNIILETRRIKNVPEPAISREIKSSFKRVNAINNLIIITKSAKIIYISR